VYLTIGNQVDVEKLLQALVYIQDMCIYEISMGNRLDAVEIGQIISDATGMTNPQLHDYMAHNA
jgi:hypothetical protein